MIKAGFAVFAAGLLGFFAFLVVTQSRRDALRQEAEAPSARAREASLSDPGFHPIQRRRPLPAVINPPTVSSAKITGLDDDELVIGLEINGQARAYPVNFISEPEQEVINDVLGETPIAVTWCSRCRNGVVFDRRIDGQAITLRVAGMLWHDNMVMIDKTGSLWSQLLGQAMRGIRKGKTLLSIPAVMTGWGNWKHDHPDTSVVELGRTSKEYRRGFLTAADDLYFGVRWKSESRAWKLSDLERSIVANDWIGEHGRDGSGAGVAVIVAFVPADGTVLVRKRGVNHRLLTFGLNDRNEVIDRETGSVWNLSTGNAVSGTLAGRSLPLLPGTLVRGRSWKLFRPESTYWKPAAQAPRN